jgi:hypothetical protein
MNIKTTLTLAAALGICFVSQAQQIPQSQTQPCVPSAQTQSKQDNVGTIQTPGVASSTLTKACQKFGICITDPHKKVTLPNSQPKPCPPDPLRPATPAPQTKTVLVCPPNTTKLPDHPYCLTQDKTLVDAIAIPDSTAPAPITSTAAPGTAQK